MPRKVHHDFTLWFVYQLLSFIFLKRFVLNSLTELTKLRVDIDLVVNEALPVAIEFQSSTGH